MADPIITRHSDFGTRFCLNGCGTEIVLKIQRDLTRKKFCSHACRQKYRWRTGGFQWFADFQKKSRTPEANAKKVHRGSDHPRWTADRSQLKCRPQPELKAWKLAVFARDNNTCQKCGASGCRLIADHIKPWCMFPELRFDISNGETLCEPCHRKTNTYARKVKFWEKIYAV